MTGSGKTGLGVVLIEEALRAGLPALLIDPKGDLTNLCLTFPACADRLPAVDRRRPGRRPAGVSPDEFAAAAGRDVDRRAWPAGASGPTDIAALRDVDRLHDLHAGLAVGRADRTSSARSRSRPTRATPRSSATRSRATSSGLLGLVGIDADPLSSREHILLSNLIAHSWQDGRGARPADAGGHDRGSRRSASSACSSSTSSSRRTTAWRWR